ncbi:enoyl-CoA hydratase/isomerase family protein [Alcanivorax sp. DP30]|uniref:enoyl-CoA hydratase/isomerase family protein n=1 Tax=Alcanivorax sp. DP30 TaxID=2606217 RepID=UPI00136ABF41|nr:enoyl-CoA hydratase/isomerase family protein [Alcanivorax sp. DP30]
MSDCVLFSELPTACGQVIARATLNAPKALNALGLDMIQALDRQLDEWEQRDDIVALWLDGAGEKAFCAGGDIVQMHKSMVKHAGEGRNPFTEQYFAEEYALDYRLHRSRIPVVVYGDGIVMGGGMGLLQGADFRLVTPRSRMAMPEITIGLFPDVGGSWFLNRLPGKAGLFLGLTGVHLNGREAVEIGLADRMVEDDADALLASLAGQRFSSEPRDNKAVLYRQFKEQAADMEALPHPLIEHLPLINVLCDGENLQVVVEQLLSATERDSWLDRALGNLEKGCPQTAHLVWEQLERSTYLSLAEVFRMEWCLAVQCSLHGDFREGVRALLIDKDGKPGFRHRSVADVPRSYIDGFFRCPAPEHPLAKLGRESVA